jgi:hypothetical protein
MRGATAEAFGGAGKRALSAARLFVQRRLGLRPSAREREVVRICQWYTLAIQTCIGLVAPLVLWACADAEAAMDHARSAGISDSDPLHRLYRRLHAALCTRQAALEWALLSATVMLTVVTTIAVVMADQC